MSGAVSNITRRRQNRYYSLISFAAKSIEKRKFENTPCSPQLLQYAWVEQYLKEIACLDNEAIQKVWLTNIALCSRIVDGHMVAAKCAKVIRANHSQNVCSKMKVYGTDGNKEQDSEIRMLLLVQNEIDRVMA
ncbi:hypothetical protein PHMEG_00035863 [Phytophthora megakarya]|uniref:Uncharacterized protein n=1 Tax=Phytophthora megakarya TaxID=4795 RepID=A0A225UPE2_9STRA|nr:hypothetical protein PHMEG_00035863 [Phytophthora megakarya]